MAKKENIFESLDISSPGSCAISLPGTQVTSTPSKGLQIKDKIGGMFQVAKILGGEGKSGMGIVYICYHSRSDSVIVLKTFQDRYIMSPQIRERFTREAMAWTCLGQHPFIVRALTVLEFDSRLFVVLEFVAPDEKGRNTLTHFFEKKLSFKQIVHWSIQFCHGMEYAASQGVTPHRDIKPDNIMITRDGDVKITDFGLARLWEQVDDLPDDRPPGGKSKSPALSLFKSAHGKSIVGTLPWMAPEQFEGKSDIRSDIYSFGIVLYQMAHGGELPFRASSPEAYYQAHKNQLVPKHKTELFPIIEKCLQKDPRKRFTNFEELRAVLIRIYKLHTGIPPQTFPQQTELSAFDHIGKGNAFHYLGMFDQAIKEYRSAIRLKSDIAAVHKNLGLVLHETGVYEDALLAYRQALRLRPMWAEVHFYRGDTYKEIGDLQQAVKEYRECLRLQPKWVEAYNRLGAALKDDGDLEGAIREYKKALMLQYDNVTALRNLGAALKDRYFAAKRELQDMITVDVSADSLSGKSLSTRMMILSLQAEDTEATVSTLEEETINEQFIEMLEYELYPGLAGLEKHKPLLSDAVEKLRMALKFDPDDGQTHYHLGVVLNEQGKSKEAIHELTAAVWLRPEDEPSMRPVLASAYFKLGMAHSDNDSLDEAVEALRKAIQYHRDYSEAHYRLGSVYYRQGELAGATGEFRIVTFLRPNDPRMHAVLGNILYARGEYDDAIESYRRALKLKIDYSPAISNLGLVYRAKGEFNQALKYLKKAVRLEPDYAPGHINIGLVYEEKRQFIKAIKEFNKALKINYDDPIPYFNLGNVYFKKNDYENAAKYYRGFLRCAAKHEFPNKKRYIKQAEKSIQKIDGIKEQ